MPGGLTYKMHEMNILWYERSSGVFHDLGRVKCVFHSTILWQNHSITELKLLWKHVLLYLRHDLKENPDEADWCWGKKDSIVNALELRLSSTAASTDWLMGLLPDALNCGLSLHRERFPCHLVLAIPTSFTARAWRVVMHAGIAN